MTIDTNKKIDIIKYFELNTRSEHNMLECKEAQSGMPKSLWDTYSSFANTNGGIILLGIKQIAEADFVVTGVKDPIAMEKDFWSSIANPRTTNRNILSQTDVQIITDISDKKVIMITVPEAANNQKPIFIRGLMENTYIRNGQGDTKATEEELHALIRNSQSDADSFILKDFTIKDLDAATIAAFKTIVISRYPNKEYEKRTDEEFLRELGFYRLDRKTQLYYPTQGCLLFFGKYNSIKDVFPSFHLDFFDYRGSTSRWIDRVASDEPNNIEMNIFNFFNIVYNKLLAADSNHFALNDNMMRIEHSLMTALREALVNSLVHADYRSTSVPIRIEIHDDYFLFKNPGKMLVSIQEFENGGNTICRNNTVMQGFRATGFAERQGMGGKEIISVAMNNKLMLPTINTNLMFTELKFWKIDAASYPDLSDDEQKILRLILNSNHPISKKEIEQNFSSLSERKIRSSLEKLIKTEKIISTGKARATKYIINPTSTEFKWILSKLISQLKDNL